MKRLRLLIGGVAAMCMMASCSIYHPQLVGIPLTNHEGETQVEATVGISASFIPDVFAAGVTVSHAFTGNLEGQAHVNYGFENAYAQVAPGLFHASEGHFVTEGFVGFGFGGAWSDGSRGERDGREFSYSGHFALPFVQGNLGWRDLAGGHLDLAFGLKVGAFLPSYTYHEYTDGDVELPAAMREYDKAGTLVEPQLQLRLGGARVMYTLRLGFAYLSGVMDSDDIFTYDWLTVSSGLTFKF